MIFLSFVGKMNLQNKCVFFCFLMQKHAICKWKRLLILKRSWNLNWKFRSFVQFTLLAFLSRQGGWLFYLSFNFNFFQITSLHVNKLKLIMDSFSWFLCLCISMLFESLVEIKNWNRKSSSLYWYIRRQMYY